MLDWIGEKELANLCLKAATTSYKEINSYNRSTPCDFRNLTRESNSF